MPEPLTASILLVDDQATSLNALETGLQPLGHRLIKANSGKEALKWVLSEEFALAILDVEMPDLDGFQTAALMRQRPASRTMPIIFLSAVHRAARDIYRGYGIGAVDYISKPFDPEILRAKVAVFVELFVQGKRLLEQAALLRHRSVLEAILKHIPVGVTIVDASDGRVIMNSQEVFRLFGDDAEASLPDAYPEWSGFHPDGRALAFDEWPLRRALATGHPTGKAEILFHHKTGKRLVTEMQATPIADEHNQPMAGVLTTVDITERKCAEEERVRLYERERAARATAEEATMLRERLLGIVGHDLRNPLNAIALSAALLTKYRALDPKQTELVGRIASSAQRMNKMIMELVDFSLAHSGGGMRLLLGETALNQICRQVIAELEIAHPERKIIFEANADVVGHWDASRLGEVVSNLVANAIEHGARAPVTVRLMTTTSQAVLHVHNFGAPIPPEILPTLFDPFRRGTARPTSGSVGLGLYIAQQIVAAHHGTLRATSSAEEGTCFTVELPYRLE